MSNKGNDRKNTAVSRLIRTPGCIILNVIIASFLLSGCGNYQSPYDRGYGEGYEKGYADASAGAEKDPVVQEETKKTTGIKRDKGEENDEAEEPAQDNDATADVQDTEDEGSDEAVAEDTEAPEDSGEEAQASDEGSESAEAATGDGSESEVLGEMASDEGGQSGEVMTPPDSSRVITAAAVNEALFSNPEVINGLLKIYEPQAIFGDFVGDTGTNTLHKVGGSYFNNLTYDRIVVFDSSKSVQDVLNEGFYTLSDDMQ